MKQFSFSWSRVWLGWLEWEQILQNIRRWTCEMFWVHPTRWSKVWGQQSNLHYTVMQQWWSWWSHNQAMSFSCYNQLKMVVKLNCNLSTPKRTSGNFSDLLVIKPILVRSVYFLSLLFSSWYQFLSFNLLACRLYNVFWSGAKNGLHEQFMFMHMQ